MESELFKIPSSLPIKQEMRNLAVDLTLERDCASGRLKMKHTYKPNKKKNHFFTELTWNNNILTFSSIESDKIMPRFAHFREEYASTNQISFNDPLGERTFREPSYGIITHRESGSSLTPYIAFLVIPDEDYGYACNRIPLKSISVPLRIQSDDAPLDEDFEFELLPALKKR